MENMDKGLTVHKWVLIVWLKICTYPKCSRIYLPDLSAQVQKFLMQKDFLILRI